MGDKSSLDKADIIIMDAYKEGMSIMSVGDNRIVLHRLRIFGEWIDGAYYLNERGFDYAANGCRKGIKEKQAKDDYILDLNIEATKKSMYDADRAFIQSEQSLAESKKSNDIARIALVFSIFLPAIYELLEWLLSKP